MRCYTRTFLPSVHLFLSIVGHSYLLLCVLQQYELGICSYVSIGYQHSLEVAQDRLYLQGRRLPLLT